MAIDRGKGCLVAVVALVAVGAVALALIGPTLARYGGRFLGSVSEMKRAEAEVKDLAREHPWQAPASPTLSAEQLERFLTVRGELQQLYEDARFDMRDLPRDRKPDIGQVTGIVEGIGSIVSRQSQIFVKAQMNPAEYRYVERLVYRRWRAALRRSGSYPVSLVAAASEIERAAETERDAAVARRLRAVAEELRSRRPQAPDGIPEEIHELLLSRLADIERVSLDDLREMPVPEAH